MNAHPSDEHYWRHEDQRFTRAEEEHQRLQADRAWAREQQRLQDLAPTHADSNTCQWCGEAIDFEPPLWWYCSDRCARAARHDWNETD